ncbi:TetR/AcrR family transcriptional regulator [Streptomyces cocklensis]|jgi:AcrR family transcriptional regulator|uniref:Transcriptional regulator, TetR family n=1 Tax=Actinacidiphila cocklensis TaxID=887465 RepID=A0A9W4DM64_9ACTN|nr:TetR/AcrR family transcriptional regulator [Actinacidiphila cocklensis]MDD1062622.1 TetR/AcrR family transcriptional regulator [Actinacidiphila cocklensis]WSX75493.1 TetR/AcrR family transcriptional regulator [Streptomyces sp. NBC_00899]CAG6392178.1 Transcriptional regulator, TetR family [Actinacidiphila cocklensis]
MRPVTRRQADHHAARSAATRAQVISTLERLLDSGEAYSEISVQRILEEAGVSRATFYAHFPSKADVLARLTDDLRESVLALARQWDPAGPGDGADRFAAYFEEVIRIHRAHQGVLTAVREAAAYESAVSDFYSADLEGFDETVLRTLRSEQAAGSTTADLEAVAASRIIVWGGAQAIAHHIRVDDGSGDAAFARELARIWWYGAYRRPAGE